MKKQSLASGLISLIIIFLCLLGSCKKSSSVTACIGTLPSTASAGFPVTFASCTSGAGSYSWNFGDGTNGTGDTTTHTYTTAGTYKGSLTVTSGSSSNSKSFTITVVNNGWTFKGASFATDSVETTGVTLFATSTSASGRAVLDFVFNSLPTTSGNYTVVNAAANNVGPNQVYVFLYSYNTSNVETQYGSTGSGAINAAVNVSGGKLSITLPSIEMVNQYVPTDSASLSAGLTQTQ